MSTHVFFLSDARTELSGMLVTGSNNTRKEDVVLYKDTTNLTQCSVFVMTSFSFPSTEISTCDTSPYQLTQWLHCVRCRFFLVRELLLLVYASYLLFTCTHLKELTVGCLVFSMISSQNRKYTCYYVGLTYKYKHTSCIYCYDLNK